MFNQPLAYLMYVPSTLFFFFFYLDWFCMDGRLICCTDLSNPCDCVIIGEVPQATRYPIISDCVEPGRKILIHLRHALVLRIWVLQNHLLPNSVSLTHFLSACLCLRKDGFNVMFWRLLHLLLLL